MWPCLNVSSHTLFIVNRRNSQDQSHDDAARTRLLQSQAALSWSMKALLFLSSDDPTGHYKLMNDHALFVARTISRHRASTRPLCRNYRHVRRPQTPRPWYRTRYPHVLARAEGLFCHEAATCPTLSWRSAWQEFSSHRAETTYGWYVYACVIRED